MTNQKRTIMGACEYSIHMLNDIKKQLLDIGNPKQKIVWAVGGMVVTLTANLIQICNSTIEEAAKSEQPSASADLRAIQAQFNDFIEKMLAASDNS